MNQAHVVVDIEVCICDEIISRLAVEEFVGLWTSISLQPCSAIPGSPDHVPEKELNVEGVFAGSLDDLTMQDLSLVRYLGLSEELD